MVFNPRGLDDTLEGWKDTSDGSLASEPVPRRTKKGVFEVTIDQSPSSPVAGAQLLYLNLTWMAEYLHRQKQVEAFVVLIFSYIVLVGLF